MNDSLDDLRLKVERERLMLQAEQLRQAAQHLKFHRYSVLVPLGALSGMGLFAIGQTILRALGVLP